MRIVGFKFKKIAAERFKEPGSKIKLSSDFNTGKPKKEDDSLMNNFKEVFSVDFDYTLTYEEISKIIFEGEIFFTFEEGDEKEKISLENRKHFLRFVLAKTHVELLHLEEQLNLPFHIKPPQINSEEIEEENKPKKGGEENKPEKV